MGDDRPSGYTEGDRTIYRASSAGMCLTALVASRLGYKPDRPKFQDKVMSNAAKEGNLHEDAIVEELKRDYGYRVWGSQDSFDLKVIPRVYFRGHVDGFCIPKGARNNRLLEIKTMSKNRFAKWKRLGSIRTRLISDEFSSYGAQISVYMKAHDNIPVIYVVKNRDSGELTIDELKLPPYPWEQIKKKIIEAEMWAKRDELPPCTASSSEQYFCAFPYLHNGNAFGDEPDDEEAPIDDATKALISGMAKHYHDLASQVALLKPLDEERKEVGKKMIEALGGPKGIKSMTAGGFKVTRGSGGHSYPDNKAIAKELGISVEKYEEILNANKKKTSYHYVRVTRVEGT